MLLQQFDSTAYYLNLSLEDARRSQSSKAMQKALNNYAILHHLQGEYNKAISCLRLIHPENEQQRLLKHLNLGDAFAASGELDSASYYYHIVEKKLYDIMVKDETKIAIIGSLSSFAESQGNYRKALEYRKEHERCNGDLRDKREKKSTYYVQQKYDYERLQREMNDRVIQKKRIIVMLVLALVVILIITLLLYHRYIQKQLREVELNNILLQFMEQNTELLNKDAEQEWEKLEMVQQLKAFQKERVKAMQTLEVLLKDRKNSIALNDLKNQLFGERDHWTVMLEFINKAYPGLYDGIKTKYPMLNELELKVVLLSNFKLSRADEAAILGVSTSVLDKVRGRVRRVKSLDF